MKITKAVIPVAGYGMRRLPITKAIEKCMLPVCNRPLIDYTVEACADAGITEIIFIVSPEHAQLRAYYSQNKNLERHLEKQGKPRQLTEIANTDGLTFRYVIQNTEGPYGTAVPVLLAKDLICDDEHFIVMMGDDFIYNPSKPGANINNMVNILSSGNAEACIIGVSLSKEQITKYSLIESKLNNKGIEQLKFVVEKPNLEVVTGNMGNVSKYAFNKNIFPYLEKLMHQRDTQREYFLTDVVNDYAATHKVAVIPSVGQYLDGGNLDDWITANNFVYKSTGRSSTTPA